MSEKIGKSNCSRGNRRPAHCALVENKDPVFVKVGEGFKSNVLLLHAGTLQQFKWLLLLRTRNRGIAALTLDYSKIGTRDPPGSQTLYVEAPLLIRKLNIVFGIGGKGFNFAQSVEESTNSSEGRIDPVYFVSRKRSSSNTVPVKIHH